MPSTMYTGNPVRIAPEDAHLKYGHNLSHGPLEEKIVISGMSGVHPKSKNIEEYRHNLYNKIDMLSPLNPPGFSHPDLPARIGSMPPILKDFDAGFFGLSMNQADLADPGIRMTLERVIEAIFDAGMNPSDFENTRTAVVTGITGFESIVKLYEPIEENAASPLFLRTVKSFVGSNIAHFLRVKGPMITPDTACSTSLHSLDAAYRAIREGLCDAAIVSGYNLCQKPGSTLQFAWYMNAENRRLIRTRSMLMLEYLEWRDYNGTMWTLQIPRILIFFIRLRVNRLGVLSPEGLCQPFDKNANGYVRSEALSVVILQKAKDAKRAYAEIVHSKTNSDGYKQQGITFPNSEAQKDLMEEVFLETNICPTRLGYLEAHGTGTPAGDPEECAAIDAALMKGRKEPLLIGSVKSSIGHAESHSGLCSTVKVILAMESGKISPNLHFNEPRDIPAITEGRLKVVTEVTGLVGGNPLIGINSFGFGGSNGHMLLRAITRKKVQLESDSLPRLVCVSGRTKEAVEILLNEVLRNQDVEYIRLLQNIFRKDVSGHIFKGYMVSSKDTELRRSVSRISLKKLPVYLVFGKFNNWYKTLKEFLELSLFQEYIDRVRSVLLKNDIDIKSSILSDDPITRRVNDALGNFITSICIAAVMKKLNLDVEAVDDFCTGGIVGAFYKNKLDFDEALVHARTLNGNMISSKLQVNGGILDGLKTNVNSLSKIERNYSNGTDGIYRKRQQIGGRSIIVIIGEAVEDDVSAEDSITLNVMTLLDFLSLFGSLYEQGHTSPIEELFPKVDFPVSRGTPTLSSSIKWMHERSWEFDYIKTGCKGPLDKNFNINLKNKDWSFISGHVIDGRILFPAAGYLYLAWQTLEKSFSDKVMKTLRFSHCRFLRATPLNSSGVTLRVSILNSGYFEITEKDAVVVTGEINVIDDDPEESYDTEYPLNSSYKNSKDIYKELRLRGYYYSGDFRSIQNVSDSNTDGLIKWTNNWIAHIDNMFQMKILQVDTRLLYVPTYIKEVTIYLNSHDIYMKQLGNENPENILVPVECNYNTDQIRSRSVIISGLAATSLKRKKYLGTPVLERYEFVPNDTCLSLPASVRVNTQIILENTLSKKVKSIEVIDSDTPIGSCPVTPILLKVLEDEPLTHSDSKILSESAMEVEVPVENEKLHQQTGCTLVIGSRFLSRPQKLAEALKAIKVDGYIISREPLNSPNFDADENNLMLLTTHETPEEMLILIGKNTRKIKSTFIDITDPENTLDWIDAVKTALSNDEETVIYSHKNVQNGLIGLINCLRREPGGENFRSMLLLDLDVDFDQSNTHFIKQMRKNMAINVFKDGKWGTYRHLLLEPNNNKSTQNWCVVNQSIKGDLSSLKWFDGQSSNVDTESMLQSDSVEVHYASINFKDVMLASGKISGDDTDRNRVEQENILGFEFSGKNKKGEKIMGMIPSGALATMVTPDPSLLWKVPNHWSLSEAATVPVVAGTIIYAMSFRANMKKGESVLIHSGTGGVGQAAIRYALHHGCAVYTTVGNESKRKFLKTVFPQLSDDNIGNSRNNSFERMIMKQTNGRGVDLVLNSLAEDKLITSVRCLARGGRFMEIGKFDMLANNALSLLLLEKEASFHGVMLDKLLTSGPAKKHLIRKLVDGGIADGSVKPLNMNLFKCNELEQAFRFMAGGKHMGKVVIEVRGKGLNNPIIPEPKYYCEPSLSYVIVGGLGGFGLELADWLILRGARKVIFSSRNGIKTGYQRSRIRAWRNYGVTIIICTADVTKRDGSLQLIQEAEKVGPVGALFNLAAILQDAIFENQTKEMFRTSLAPKADVTKYLDEITRKFCPQLSDFVVFSSVSCGRGNTGQTNYGMGNSVMERICEQRKKDNYPALAIQWGAIGEVGLVADMQDNHLELEISGTLQQRLSNCMDVLDILLAQKGTAVVSSMVVAEKKSLTNTDNIAEAIASVLGITDIKSVSSHSTLPELGMDSMTAIEIKQILERDIDLCLSTKEIRNLTLDSLMKIQESRGKATADTMGVFKDIYENQEARIRNIKNLFRNHFELQSRLSTEDIGPTVSIFPGIEGTSEVLKNLALNLNAHVIFHPYNFETGLRSIHEMANSHLDYIENKLKKEKDKRFFFVAYSYGVSVALEVIRILESRGYTGTLVALDGSPEHSKKMMVAMGDSGGVEFILNVLSAILEIPFSPTEIEEVKQCDLEEKVNKVIDIMSAKTDISQDNLRNICGGLVLRGMAMQEYSPTKTNICSRVIVCKPLETRVDCSEDLGFSDICELPVKVHTFEGNHISILDNKQLTDLINSIL